MSKKEKKETTTAPEAPQEAAVEEPEEESGGGAPNDEESGEVAELARALDECRQEARRNHDLYLRMAADLDNFRKRAQREREDLAKFANEKILREVLPVIDNLERAVEHARQEGGNSKGLVEGVEMTLSQFAKVLEKFGVAPLESVGKPFDPARHEAMGQLESAQHPANTVAQELQKGYVLHERLLRPALVMVTKVPAAGGEGEQSSE
ncbi:nucleotide exchange factor GrpE [Geoalkalibacter halelectricus]|uniref:Protein GrpE n=1 Tax=Geoalkalibacter halelectricus TaxID=2847045 RepID=A0ABY5ZNQ6_9BACT|nr:nucleotide exchange factor GrpE [Geoalkalibacter halelectricus]MDO3378319.1 nucleotide exchange factor GrpE [Geoalkalibacter halelectricus]UWZ79324.1 nucleotide exchange factor GrpE [Geoalkalibacter halelectricus]